VTREPIWQVVTTIMDIVTENSVKLRLAMSPPDVLMRPELGTIGILDFHTIDDGIAAGRQAARRSAAGLERLLTRRVADKQRPSGEEEEE
jgi:predicted acylesterase/phospholipase RssA